MADAFQRNLRMKSAAVALKWISICDRVPRGLVTWPREHHVAVLNVSGSRESKAPGIQGEVCEQLVEHGRSTGQLT